MGNLPILTTIFVSCCFFGPLEASVGPKFVNSPEPIVAPLGDEVEFECSLDVPAEQIKWQHNQRLLPVTFNNTARSQLIFKMETEAQVGDYQCIAWYGASALASVPAKLSLARLGSRPSPVRINFLISSGNNFVINCSVPYSNPPPVIQYFKSNEPLRGATILESGALFLSSVQPKDSGPYTCSITNDYVSPSTILLQNMYNLSVVTGIDTRPPQFPYLPKDSYSLQKGSNVTLECVAFGEPVPKVSWQRKGGTPLSKGRMKQLKAGLRIQNVRLDDEGTYTCIVENGVSSPLHYDICVTVLEATIIVKGPKDDRVKEGGRVVLECSVQGKPTPHITWLLNGNVVNNDSFTRINGGVLELNKIEKKHAGWYQCMAENELSAAFESCMLLVVPKQVTVNSSSDFDVSLETPAKESPPPFHKKTHRKHKNGSKEMVPPSKPTVTRLTDTSVMVRWHVPPNTGLPILFFKVQHRELSKGKSSRWMTNNGDIPSHVGSYEVTGLTPDADYRFRIAAVYSNHDNKLSANSLKFHLQSGTTSRQVPPAPILTHTTSAGPEAINIFWELPSRGDRKQAAAVEGFYVYYRITSNAGDYMKRTVEGENTRSCIITHLQSDTAYEVKVQSFTVNAASEFSEILTQKTERSSTMIPSVTETPPIDIIGNNDVESHHKGGNQLYVTLGAVLGVLALLLTLCMLIFCCNKHRQHLTSNSDDGEDGDKTRHIQMEAIHMNGHVMGSNARIGGGPGANSATNDIILKSKKNTKTNSNGCCGASSKMNITSNPLDSDDSAKAQNVMEIAFITTNSCEENCSSSVLTARLASSATVLPSCAMESETWRRAEMPRTLDNYV